MVIDLDELIRRIKLIVPVSYHRYIDLILEEMKGKENENI